MAVINFPDPSQSPWTNTVTGVTYSYINGAWKVTGSAGGGSDASITVSASPPVKTTLEEGALWWNSASDDASLYVLYVDPDTSTKYWVEASPTTGIDLSTLAVLPPAGE
jgi:hypothetical protein